MDPMTDEQRYAAILSRDARFDGVFFTCVQSTGIFCRPSCPSRTPRRDRVVFAASAAAAAEAGFRACRRCGPAAPPGSPDHRPAGTLAARALDLIEVGELDHGSVPDLARRLAVSERTLHRALLRETGAGALAHARVHRARRAHELLRGTDLPLAEIAYAAGFGSERQFHDTIRRIYGQSPTDVRLARPGGKTTGASAPAGPGEAGAAHLSARLRVREPFDGLGLADWFSERAVPGVEEVDGLHWLRALHLPHGPAVLETWLETGGDGDLPLTVHLSDIRDYPHAVSTARRLLDLDADPVGIEQALATALPPLASLIAARPGVRIPGTPTLAEALLWGIVGQQITVAQTRDQIIRLADQVSEPLPRGLRIGALHRLPPSPSIAAETAEQWYRGPRARRAALVAALSRTPDPALPLPALRDALVALPGIGPWTAEYALLRSRRATDVAPVRDVALQLGARDLGMGVPPPVATSPSGGGSANRARTDGEQEPAPPRALDLSLLQQQLEAASPWRSYAAMHLWHHARTVGPGTRRTRTPRTTRTTGPRTEEIR